MTRFGRLSWYSRLTASSSTRLYSVERGTKMDLQPRSRSLRTTADPRKPDPPVTVTVRFCQNSIRVSPVPHQLPIGPARPVRSGWLCGGRLDCWAELSATQEPVGPESVCELKIRRLIVP